MKNLNFLTNSKTILGIIFCLSIVTANAQIVNFTNTNFKNALLNHDPVINTNGDGEIQLSEAAAFTGTINVSGKDITATDGLVGLEYFFNITELDCSNNNIGGTLNLMSNAHLTSVKCNSNQLTGLNVTTLVNLDFLHCSTNNLTSLDVSNNIALKTLWASNNQLTTIDVSNNTALENLSVQNNNLTGTLDVTASPNLMYLQCFNNDLTEIDAHNLSLTLLEVYNNPSLTFLNCNINDLTSLDLSGLPSLENLYCSFNQLTSLDLSASPALDFLNCSLNQLTSLDVSTNPDLTTLYCDSNQLTNLNVANGNNINFTAFWADNNDLDCIRIDSGFTPPTDGSWIKDPGTEYDPNCALGVSDIETFAFSIYPNPVKDILTIDSQNAVEKIEVYDLSGKKVMEVTGQKQVNMSSLAPGTYMLRVVLGKTVETVKVIKK